MDTKTEKVRLEFDQALFMGILVTLGIVISAIAIKFGGSRVLIFCGADDAKFIQTLLKESKVTGSFRTISACEASYTNVEGTSYILLDSPHINYEPSFERLFQKLIKDKKEFYFYNVNYSKEVLSVRGSGEPQAFLKKIMSLD